jgi:outer membrane protein OmpA-like peptidoglycan-associated protein
MYEANVMARYDDRLYAAVGYRKGSDFIISTGASLSPGIVLNYSYEFSTQGIMNYSSGTHEISIGFLIRRSKSKTPPPTIFRENDETPAVDTTLAIRLKKLEIQLAECDCEKKEEMLTKLDERLKKLEVAVDVADAESWEKPFILENIKFGNNSSKLFASSFPELNKLADKMKRNPELILKISGYTDNNGSEKYNVKLSQDRADAVKSYLVKEGCEPDRIETIGRGQENPIASNDDPTGRALNRRIEGQFKK